MQQKDTILEFNMLNGEEKHIKLSYKKVIVLLESLYNFKRDIKNNVPVDQVGKMIFETKLQEVSELMESIEKEAEYNFNKKLEKCRTKKSKKDEAGMDALSASIILKEEDD